MSFSIVVWLINAIGCCAVGLHKWISFIETLQCLDECQKKTFSTDIVPSTFPYLYLLTYLLENKNGSSEMVCSFFFIIIYCKFQESWAYSKKRKNDCNESCSLLLIVIFYHNYDKKISIT